MNPYLPVVKEKLPEVDPLKEPLAQSKQSLDSSHNSLGTETIRTISNCDELNYPMDSI